MDSDEKYGTELFSDGCVYKVKEVRDLTVTVHFGGDRGWTTFNKSESSTEFEWGEWCLLSDYFYSKIELRKLKLEKIESR